jgi:hypothetical protein
VAVKTYTQIRYCIRTQRGEDHPTRVAEPPVDSGHSRRVDLAEEIIEATLQTNQFLERGVETRQGAASVNCQLSDLLRKLVGIERVGMLWFRAEC